jgi:Tol biopolymer transport system component
MSKRIRPGGFSLFEVLAVFGLLLVTLGVSLTAVRSPGRDRSPDSAAAVVVSALRAAQSEARATGVPVGFALATSGGQAAAGFYTVRGHVLPRVSSVTDLRSEFPGTYLACVAGSGATSVSQPDTGDDFLVGTWALPYPGDPTLIFLPSGKVLSNGLCHGDGVYHLVLGTGLEFGGQAVGQGDPLVSVSAPTYTLSAIANPQTVTVTQSGAIALVTGFPEQPNVESLAAAEPSVGTLPSLDPPSGDPPEIIAIKALPERDDLPPGVDALIPENGMLSLVVEAWSPAGEELYAEWSGPGQFSAAEPIPLQWHPVDAVWRGTIEWKVPSTVPQGDEVALSVKVSDRYTDTGMSLSGQVTQALTVEVTRPKSKLVFAVPGEQSVFQVHNDGSGEKQLFAANMYNVRWSPDGTKLVGIVSPGSTGAMDLVLAHPDAGPLKVLYSGQNIATPRWSPDGTRIAFVDGLDLFVVGADGAPLTQVTPSDSFDTYGGYNWSPDGQKVVYAENLTSFADQRLWTANPDGSGRAMITDFDSKFPVWAAGEDRILFLGFHSSDPQEAHIWSIKPDGSDLRMESNNADWSGFGWNADTVLGLSANRRFVSFDINRTGLPPGLNIMDRVTGTASSIAGTSASSYQYGIWSPDDETVLAFDSSSAVAVLSRPDGSNRLELGPKTAIAHHFADWTK